MMKMMMRMKSCLHHLHSDARKAAVGWMDRWINGETFGPATKAVHT